MRWSLFCCGILPVLLLGLAATLADAAPAPWYRWRSLSTGAEACARSSPGAGWARSDGPFVDPACTRPLRTVRL